MNSLLNKIIVVTGGSGLIGTSIVQDLSVKGAIAINADIHEADNLAEGVIRCDVSDENSIKQTLQKVIARYERIDGWVNNAYPRTSDWGNDFENVNLASWNRNVELQLASTFLCSQLVLKIMKEQKSGSLVNLSSIYGVVGPDFSVYDGTAMTMPAAYSAIKGGIINFTRYLASYYGPYGIRVNCVSPGGIFNDQAEQFVSNYERKVPLRRMGLSKDISPAVTFLLSDEASYITGHNLIIDGGWTAI